MLMTRAAIAFALLIPSVAVAEASEPQIRFVGTDINKPTAIEITGLPKAYLNELAKLGPNDPAWTKALAVFVVDDAGAISPPAMLGTYAADAAIVRFAPRFSLRPGVKYRVVVRPPVGEAQGRDVTKDIAILAATGIPSTRVTAIYPSADTLPENQLRFYVHFSAPMAAGNAYEHVKLLKADGNIVNRAFLEIGEELWDGTGTRITLLFDPGRVKKGLSPREQFGPVLEAGQNYRLVIEKKWRDANNQPLAADFEKHFTAGPPLESAVDVKQWKIEPPIAGSVLRPLIVHFPRSLDRALLNRMINVVDSANKPVTGDIAVADDERRWQFIPDKHWVAGKHELIIDTALEDSAGNNLARPFEVDVFDRVDKQAGPEFVRLPFNVQ